MWTEISKQLPEYKSAVVTGVDAQGYPFSVRCRPEPIFDAKALKIHIPNNAYIQPGPASLLCHKYDEQFWNQHSFVVWGMLERCDGGWVFHPKRFTPGAAADLLTLLRFVINARRASKQYLEKRHLARPKVPWNEIKTLWAEVERTK